MDRIQYRMLPSRLHMHVRRPSVTPNHNISLEKRYSTIKIKKRNGQLVGVDMTMIATLGKEAQARAYKDAGVDNKRI